MSYINKEELLGRMILDSPINWTDSERELGEESQYRHDMELIKNSAEVDVVPISVIENIKTELKAISYEDFTATDGEGGFPICNLNEVLDIIDKYINGKESE